MEHERVLKPVAVTVLLPMDQIQNWTVSCLALREIAVEVLALSHRKKEVA